MPIIVFNRLLKCKDCESDAKFDMMKPFSQSSAHFRLRLMPMLSNGPQLQCKYCIPQDIMLVINMLTEFDKSTTYASRDSQKVNILSEHLKRAFLSFGAM